MGSFYCMGCKKITKREIMKKLLVLIFAAGFVFSCGKSGPTSQNNVRPIYKIIVDTLPKTSASIVDSLGRTGYKYAPCTLNIKSGDTVKVLTVWSADSIQDSCLCQGDFFGLGPTCSEYQKLIVSKDSVWIVGKN